MVTPRLNINKDISKAHTLPSEFYNQNYFFELSKETIFKRSWQLITDTKIFNKHKLLSILNKYNFNKYLMTSQIFIYFISMQF